MQTHEQLDREHEVAVSSERGFGFVFAGVCAAIAGMRAWNGHADAAWWLAIAAAFAVLARFWTAPLAPLNRAWARLGRALHAIVNPVLMGLLFVVSIAPIGLLMRLAGKDLLRLRRDPSATTYWIACPPAERADAMKDQF
jgi:hypothetical protein